MNIEQWLTCVSHEARNLTRARHCVPLITHTPGVEDQPVWQLRLWCLILDRNEPGSPIGRRKPTIATESRARAPVARQRPLNGLQRLIVLIGNAGECADIEETRAMIFKA